MFCESFTFFDISFQYAVIAMTGKAFEREQIEAILGAGRNGTASQTVTAEIPLDPSSLTAFFDNCDNRKVRKALGANFRCRVRLIIFRCRWQPYSWEGGRRLDFVVWRCSFVLVSWCQFRLS